MIFINPSFVASSSASGLGALGVNFTALGIQLITFVLAYLVLRKWAFGPIVKILQQRRELIEDGVKLGEKMRSDESALEETIEKTLHETRAQADKLITEAQETSKQMVTDAEVEAKTKAEQLLKDAEIRTHQDLSRAKRKLEVEMANLVAQATSAVLDEKVDVKKDAGLIQRALAGRKDF